MRGSTYAASAYAFLFVFFLLFHLEKMASSRAALDVPFFDGTSTSGESRLDEFQTFSEIYVTSGVSKVF